MEKPQKPAPSITSLSKPFWDAAREERLILQKCGDCAKFIFYPRIFCPHCHSENLGWEKASGRGTVYSYTVVMNNPPSFFKEDVPYIVAVIRLDDGVRMLSNIVGCSPEDVRCDMPVEVAFEKLSDEVTLPKFRPRKG